MKLLPRSREGRFAFGAVAVVVAVNLVTVAIDAFLPSPEGPPSSSFATAPRGSRAGSMRSASARATPWR